MIVFDLTCRAGHRFEGWFASSVAYDSQVKRGLVTCPTCGSSEIAKAPMAPAVPAKGNARGSEPPPPAANSLAPEMARAVRALADAQARALQNSTWVGDRFAETSRAIHYGEREPAIVHGRATAAEARSLADEGIPVSALPFPVAPPDEIN